MFSPVGNRPPSVYWRRRIMVVGSAVLLVVLLALTLRAVTDGDDTALAGGPGDSGSPTSASPSNSSQSSSKSPSSPASSPRSSRSTSKASKSATAPPARCAKSNLAIQAVAAKKTYQVGSQPTVELQVTNTGSKSCVQDLADRQVVLMVYNGESRVWGSHDCEIQDGTDDRTLLAGSPVRVSVMWSGRTSQEGCKGTRQRVGAGTYTLYAELSGTRGRAAQFAIG